MARSVAALPELRKNTLLNFLGNFFNNNLEYSVRLGYKYLVFVFNFAICF